MRESVCSRSNFFRSPREHNTKEIELGMLSTYVLNFLTYKTNASDIFAIALQEKSTQYWQNDFLFEKKLSRNCGHKTFYNQIFPLKFNYCQIIEIISEGAFLFYGNCVFMMYHVCMIVRDAAPSKNLVGGIIPPGWNRAN